MSVSKTKGSRNQIRLQANWEIGQKGQVILLANVVDIWCTIYFLTLIWGLPDLELARNIMAGLAIVAVSIVTRHFFLLRSLPAVIVENNPLNKWAFVWHKRYKQHERTKPKKMYLRFVMIFIGWFAWIHYERRQGYKCRYDGLVLIASIQHKDDGDEAIARMRQYWAEAAATKALQRQICMICHFRFRARWCSTQSYIQPTRAVDRQRLNRPLRANSEIRSVRAWIL